MAAILLKRLAICLEACGAILAGILTLQADSRHVYPESGTVISVTTVHGDVYTIETESKLYRMECIKARIFQTTPPLCEISGKPIAVKDMVRFRSETEDGVDVALIPSSGNREEKLLILSTELKILPALPTTSHPLAGESCVVLGDGMDPVDVEYPVANSAPAPSMPTGPVTAVPVTGGPPVQVIPAGPATGGVVTGVPVTGGPPVTAISVAPVTSTNTGGTSTVTDSVWVHYLRVQTAGRVYKLACRSKECWLKDRAPQLGNLLTIRVQEKAAYLSWRSPGPKGEQKFTILSVNNVD